MKKVTFLFLSFLFISITACSSDDNNTVGNGNENPTPNSYAMTAKINGVLYNMNNPFGGNESSPELFSTFPDDEFVHLQGWPVNSSMGSREITIHIKRSSDLAVGTYLVSPDTDSGMGTHIDLIDNTNSIGEYTVSGNVTITEIDTNAKIVKGTFEFDTADDTFGENPEINYSVTEGTFNYKYDVE